MFQKLSGRPSGNISNSAKVLGFMEAFEQSVGENILDGRAVTLRLLSLRLRLIEESAAELAKSVEDFSFWSARFDIDAETKREKTQAAFVEIIDSLAGLLYAVYGFFHAFGVDADAALEAVHESNMSKLDEYGRPIYREDGRVLKGPSYRPPDFSAILSEYLKACNL